MFTTREVILRVPSITAAREHYANAMGFPIVLDTAECIGFDTGVFTLYFEQGAPTGPVFEIEVDDLPSAQARFETCGCIVLEADPDIPRLYMRDPIGLVFNVAKKSSASD